MSDQTKLQHFIGGERVPPASGEYFESTNPATREVLYHAARGNAADVDASEVPSSRMKSRSRSSCASSVFAGLA